MQIRSDVWLIDTGASNCYLCRDDDGFSLIDTGSRGKADLIFGRLRDLGAAPTDLARILLTHADFDHVGSAADVRERSGAVVYASAETQQLIADGRPPKHLPRAIEMIARPFVRYPAVDGGHVRALQDGDTLPVLGGLQVIATPGHCADHISFYSPQTGVLFVGDVMNTRNGRLQLMSNLLTGDPGAARESARKLLGLGAQTYACGHGLPLEAGQAEAEALLEDLREGV